MASLAGVFVLFFIALNAMLSGFNIRPVHLGQFFQLPAHDVNRRPEPPHGTACIVMEDEYGDPLKRWLVAHPGLSQ